MSAPSPMLTTRCKFCGEEFHHEPFVPILNGTPDGRRAKMAQVLLMHGMQKHGPQLQAMMLAACFQFQDDVILKELNGARWTTLQMSAKNWLPDEALEHQFAMAGFDAEQIASVKEFRDMLFEVGKYAPPDQRPAERQPEPLIVP